MMCSFVSRRQCERGRTRHRFAQISWKKTGGVTSLTQNRYNEKTGVEPRFGRKPRFGRPQITESVRISIGDESEELRNDAVIISAGGILPTAFLRKIGINVETKWGTE